MRYDFKQSNKMDIQGKIIFIGELRQGTSARTNQPWAVQSFVLETVNEQYPRKCVFEVFGSDKIQQFNIQMGQEYTVSFDIDAHEHQGRWYNSIRAWKVVPGFTAPAAPLPGATTTTAPTATGAPAGSDDTKEDLPF